ncbi:hypothetical protein [Phocaeicola salanitronis]|uniref:hypothetical protein n=1 Tax=Phocaeicola salanitronis TaxID=376805 RepID=UPI0023F89BB9|nr:hypothetical protein [Phocaeicola salanitronis]
MDKNYSYNEYEERKKIASEPVMDYEISSYQSIRTMKSGNDATSFEEEWEKGLSVEQFREHCITRLREIYE